MLYAQFGTELIECMLTRRHTCARSEQTISELLAVIGEDVFNFDGASLMQRLQEFARISIERLGQEPLLICVQPETEFDDFGRPASAPVAGQEYARARQRRRAGRAPDDRRRPRAPNRPNPLLT